MRMSWKPEFIPASNEPSHACVCFLTDAFGVANAARGAKHPVDACYAPTVSVPDGARF